MFASFIAHMPTCVLVGTPASGTGNPLPARPGASAGHQMAFWRALPVELRQPRISDHSPAAAAMLDLLVRPHPPHYGIAGGSTNAGDVGSRSFVGSDPYLFTSPVRGSK